MLAIFPPPHPDEHIYSIESRYHELLGYEKPSDTNLALYGKPHRTATLIFPAGLEHLSNKIPGRALSADQLLLSHTSFRYFSAFMSPKEREYLRTYMLKNLTSKSRPPIPKSVQTSKKHLNYCPLCVKEDRTKFRETYWRRLHQLPGVIICLKHDVFLEASHATTSNKNPNRYYQPAETTIGNILTKPRSLLNHPDHQVYRALAALIENLLLQSPSPNHQRTFREQFLYILKLHGWTWENDLELAIRLQSAVLQKLGHTLLESLGLHTNNEIDSSWIYRAISKDSKGYTLPQLLLLYTFDLSIDRLIRSPSREPIIKKAQLPCSNQSCLNHKSIQEIKYELHASNTDNDIPNPPKYIFNDPGSSILAKILFSCGCGLQHEYQLLGNRQDRLNQWFIRSSDSVWSIGFLLLWHSNLSLNEVAQWQNTNSRHIHNIAKRFNIEPEPFLNALGSLFRYPNRT